MSRSARLILGLIGIVGILAASAAFMWWFGEWTHKLVYEDQNWTAMVLIYVIIFGGACAAELWDKGEIRLTKNFAIRPRWKRNEKSFTAPRTDAPPIVELRPDEYRRERPE